jgi:hypothetical protein
MAFDSSDTHEAGCQEHQWTPLIGVYTKKSALRMSLPLKG